LIRKIGLWTGVVVVTVALVGTVLGVWAVRRSFPEHGGTLRLAGLTAPVTVHRDGHGIPQLYAQTAEDLFRAQGYVHAQDRFWEMDVRRHVTSGRVAELFGQSQVETDAFLRTMGWRHVADQEWQMVSPETRALLTAYAGGVNSWLAEHDGGTASLEYSVLGLTNRGYRIAPWDPVDSLAWLKAMAWDLRGNMEDEIRRAALVAHGLSRDEVEQLYPTYPFDRNQPIVTQGAVVDGAFDASATPPEPAQPSPRALPFAGDPAAAKVLDRVANGLARLPSLLGQAGPGIGSNSLVIAGSHTTTGKPILANDPHLSPSLPGIWYQMGLHCECVFNVVGFTFSGVPGVIIGHSDRIAWGFTNLNPDVTDLYLEKMSGDQYEVDGELREVAKRTEVINVAGGDPVTITIRTSKHGPLISDASTELRRIGQELPRDADDEPYAVALRWTALDPGRTIEALFAMNRVRTWTEGRAAAALFDVPAQNIVYADMDGNIGYQSPGKVPIRAAGDGRWMSPGWQSQYDWTGYVPFAELPSVLNPTRGYLVTANQAVIGPQYANFLTNDWAYGYRSQRINELIGARLTGDAKVSPADVAAIQFDNRNGLAATIVPTLLQLGASGYAERAVELLRTWDFQQPADGPAGSLDGRRSAAAAYFNAFWRHLLADVFDELPADYAPDGGDRWFEVIRALFGNSGSKWWDDLRTPGPETARDVVLGSLTAAAEELRAAQGDDPAGWRWGRMHHLTLEHQTLGMSGIAPIEWLFNHGPAGVAGGDAIVNATGWDAAEGYEVDAVPSMRMVVDMSNLDSSQWIQLTGNSGHAFHANYHDQFELWRTGQLMPMRWDRATIAREAANTQTLRP